LRSSDRSGVRKCAVVVSLGQTVDPFARLIELDSFADLPFEQPRIFAVSAPLLPATEYAALRQHLDDDRSIGLVSWRSSG
jgi:hypothetical protein